MKTKIKDGGPAFSRPASEYTASGTCSDGNYPEHAHDGMSLRDYFAAHCPDSEIEARLPSTMGEAKACAASLGIATDDGQWMTHLRTWARWDYANAQIAAREADNGI